MSVQNTTSINNLPNTSFKEEDLVNKILQELETEEVDEPTLVEPSSKNIQQIDKILLPTELPQQNVNMTMSNDMSNNNSFSQNTPDDTYRDEYSKNISFNQPNPYKYNFITRLFPNVNMAQLYSYAQLSIVSLLCFLAVIFMTPKFYHIISKFPILVNSSSDISSIIHLSKTGVFVQSFVHALFFFFISFFIVKK
jgi:hypothetical protein